MNIQQPAGSIPSHVDPSRLVPFDMFNLAAVDGEYQLAAARYLQADIPDIFYTTANGGHWVFRRTEDIHHALSHPETYSANKMFVPKEKNPDPPLRPLMSDPPEHAKFRSLLAPAFSPKVVARLAEKARTLTIELVEELKPKGECEFVSEFAERLPIVIFMDMVGLPDSDRDMLMEFGEQHVRPLTAQHHIDSMRNLHAYSVQKIKERRANPGEDLISVLTQSKIDGQLVDDAALAGVIILLLVAGLDTVASSLGAFAKFLAESPSHRHQLLKHPELASDAVEELMRRFAVATSGRMVTTDHEYGGVQFKAGDMLIMPTIFTGLDAEKFDDPLKVDFERPVITHGAFGLGQHRCIGSTLARSELRVFLEEWLPRIPDFSVKPGVELAIRSGTVSGLTRLPLVWKV
jgi:cytochrome P450